MATKTFGLLIPCAIALGGTLAASTPALSASLVWNDIAGQFKSGPDALTAPQSFAVGTGTVQVGFNVGSGTKLVDFSGHLTPEINNVLNGLEPDSNPSLHLQMNTELGQYGNNNSVTTSVDFKNYGGAVQNVGFWLYDIDISGDKGADNLLLWQDRVKVVGYKGTTAVNAIFSNLGQNVANLGNGVLQGIASTDNEQDTSNVWVQFAGDIDSFDLVFTDGDSNTVKRSDPDFHGIGIGNIEFKPVPEPATLGALGAFALMGAMVRRKQTKQQ